MIIFSLFLPLILAITGRSLAFSSHGVDDSGHRVANIQTDSDGITTDQQQKQTQDSSSPLNFGQPDEKNFRVNVKSNPTVANGNHPDKGFFDFIDNLFDFGPKTQTPRSLVQEGSLEVEAETNRPQSQILNFDNDNLEQSVPSNNNNNDQATNNNDHNHGGWFFGLSNENAKKKEDSTDQAQDNNNNQENSAENNNNDVPANINNVTSRLDNWLNQILDRLDSIFDNSTPKSTPESTITIPAKDTVAIDQQSSSDQKSDQSPDDSDSNTGTDKQQQQQQENSATVADPDLLKKPGLVDSWGEIFRTVTEKNVPPPDEDTPEPATISNVPVSTNNQKPIIIITYEDDDNNNSTEKSPTKQDDEELAIIPTSTDVARNSDENDKEIFTDDDASSSKIPDADSTPTPDSGSQESSSQSYKNVVEYSKELKVSSDESSDKSDGVVDPFIDPVFCRAKCMELCMTTNGNGFPECKTVCMSSTLKDLCSHDDKPCLKACGAVPINVELNAPNVTEIKYFSKDNFVDPETVEITWNPMEEAKLYVISIIPDSRSVESGSVLIREDFTNVPWYTFKKDDLCYTYYVRVAAVYSDGITPFSQPRFLDKAWSKGFPPIKVEAGEIGVRKLMVNELSSIDFAEINLHLYSSLIFDFTKLQMSSYLLATGCPNVPRGNDDSPLSFVGTTGGVSNEINGNSSEKILVRNVQFLYLPHQVIVRLPVEFIPLGCNYEFRIALVRTRCGEIIPFVSRIGISFDSKIGADFKLGCDNVQYDGCKRSIGDTTDLKFNSVLIPDNVQVDPGTPVQPEIPSSLARKLDESDDSDDSDDDTTSSSSTVICNLSGFSVDVIGTPADGFNVTLSWDALSSSPSNDDKDGVAKPKTYVVRHGRVARRFVRDSATDAGVYDDDDTASADPDLIIPDDGMSSLAQKTVKLNRPLGSTELHLVRICVAPPDVMLRKSDWEGARRYAIDMAAFPQPSFLAIDPPGPSATQLMLTPGDEAVPPPPPPASQQPSPSPSVDTNDVGSSVQIAPDLTLIDSFAPNWKDLPRPSDPAVTSPPSSIMQAESDAAVDRLSNSEWYRRLYLAERYAESYWFYTWAFAFLVLLLSLMLCTWAFKRCCGGSSGKKSMVNGPRSYLAKKQPMIFVTRADSMKQPIVPNIVLENPVQNEQAIPQAENVEEAKKLAQEKLPPV